MPKVNWTPEAPEEEESATWQECVVIYLTALVLGAMLLGSLSDQLDEQMIYSLKSHSVEVGFPPRI